MSDMSLNTAAGAPVAPHRNPSGGFARHNRVWIIALGVAAVVIFILAYGGYFLGWNWTGFDGNTFWDWLSLLITPVTLAVISVLFSIQQNQKSLLASEHQQQDSALTACMEQLTRLLVEQDLKRAPQGSPVRDVARAHALTALRRVDEPRRAVLLHFLDESGLLGKDAPLVDLSGVELA
ncbi:MAG TPA: hypothetical protein VF116_01435 [Ktedonobacterales bacterium]